VVPPWYYRGDQAGGRRPGRALGVWGSPSNRGTGDCWRNTRSLPAPRRVKKRNPWSFGFQFSGFRRKTQTSRMRRKWGGQRYGPSQTGYLLAVYSLSALYLLRGTPKCSSEQIGSRAGAERERVGVTQGLRPGRRRSPWILRFQSRREPSGSAGGLLEFDSSGNRPALRVGARPVPPHPNPLPKEREPHRPCSRTLGVLRSTARRDRLLPLPKGEGWGEGEGDARTTHIVRMGLDIRPSPERSWL
jgi:hypothetical protein